MSTNNLKAAQDFMKIGKSKSTVVYNTSIFDLKLGTRTSNFVLLTKNKDVIMAYERMVNPRAFEEDGKPVEA